MLPVEDLKSINPQELVQLIPAGYLSHRTSPRLMNYKIDTPARRKPNVRAEAQIPGSKWYLAL